ncbi:MAG: thioredoxin family protein [Planctomycetota bacterium]
MTAKRQTKHTAAEPARWIALCTALLAYIAPYANANPGELWQQDYATAKQQAIDTGRLLLIEYSRESCGWCRTMKQTTHQQPRVISTLKRDFIPVRLKNDGDGLKKTHSVPGTPHTLIVDPQSLTLIARIGGFVAADDYLVELQQAKARQNLHTKHPDAFTALLDAEKSLQNNQLDQALDAAERGLAEARQATPLLIVRVKAQTRAHNGKAAVADLKRALKRMPNDIRLYRVRAFAKYDAGDFRGAAEDFDQALRLHLQPAHYDATQRWYAMAAAGHADRADRVLRDYLRGKPNIEGDGWFRTVSGYLAGRYSEETLLRFARRPYQRLQAYRAMAAKARLAGDRDTALKHLHKAASFKQVNVYDHTAVRAEISALTP